MRFGSGAWVRFGFGAWVRFGFGFGSPIGLGLGALKSLRSSSGQLAPSQPCAVSAATIALRSASVTARWYVVLTTTWMITKEHCWSGSFGSHSSAAESPLA